ncbi:MAG: LuxR C-terminal-related transcriptional regulator [Chloroflexota bacterium]|nr:LuxR C-terminal-related transcriptional regulator [Chloroflexota bacterium]
MTSPDSAPLHDADRRLVDTIQRLLNIRSIELRPALDEAASLVAEVLGADKVDVFLYRADIDSLVAMGTSATPMGRRQHELGLDRLQLANAGPQGEVYLTGAPYLTGRANQDPTQLRGVVDGLGVRSQADVPLVIDGKRRGILAANSATPERFSEADLRFLAAVADWIGMMTHRAEEYERALGEAEQRGRRRAAEEITRISPRERDVAMLVAEGLTNAEIARRLAIVEGTVANHVEHILRKLGLRGRTQIAVWAVEHGLYRLGQDEDEPEPPAPTTLRPVK